MHIQRSNTQYPQAVELEVAINEEKLDDTEGVDVKDVDVLELNDCEAELICEEPCAFVDIADEEDVDTGTGLADVVEIIVVSDVAAPVAAGVESAKTV